MSAQSVVGGDINAAWDVRLADGRRVFVKSNARPPPGMFQAEAEGLRFLAAAASGLVVPEVLASSEHCLILDWLEPSPGVQDDELGRGLARLHQVSPPHFGLAADNFIGTLRQVNQPRSTGESGGLAGESEKGSWCEFYRERRLSAQLGLPAARRAFGPSEWRCFDRLLNRLDEFVGPQEPPARLHGDLWGGNWMATSGGPAVFDPAAYGGHREVDLAMMRLFGGFSPRVFAAYQEMSPLADGASDRVPLYQLYPLLVHLNLFGGSYARPALAIAQRYVA